MKKYEVKISSIFKTLFVIFMVLWIYNDFNTSISKMYKYGVFYGIVLLSLIWVIKNNYLKIVNPILTRSFVVYMITIFSISLVLQYIYKQNNPNFYFRYLQLISPYIFIYLIYNIGGNKFLLKTIDCMFWLLTIGYLIHIVPNLSLETLRAFNFSESSSAFEGINYADNFLQLFIFYYLFDKRNSKVKIAISFVLNFFCFKRFHLLYSFFVLIFGKKLKDIKVSRKIINIGVIILLIAPILIRYVFNNYIEISSNYAVNNTNPLTILMGGRNVFIKQFLNAGTPSIGVGGTDYNIEIVTGGWVSGLHNDILTMYFDTTLIGLFTFVNMLANCLRTNKKILLFLLFFIIDMMVNPVITNLVAWIQFYAIFFYLYEEDSEKDEYAGEIK